MSPALQGRFLTPGPPGRPPILVLNITESSTGFHSVFSSNSSINFVRGQLGVLMIKVSILFTMMIIAVFYFLISFLSNFASLQLKTFPVAFTVKST